MNLTILTLLCLTLNSFVFLTQAQGIVFNCQRTNVDCVGVNSTCPDDGSATCVCENDDAGYDCGYNRSSIVTGGCQSSCENGGTCVMTSAGLEECYCAQEYYGKNCEKPRVSLECKPASMEMAITPHVGGQGFAGFVYIRGQDSEPACNFDAATVDGVLSLTKTIQYTDCGGAAKTTTTGGDTVRSFVAVVQYDPDFQTVDDEEFNMKCSFKPSGSLISMTTGFDQDNGTNNALGGGTIEAKLNPVELDVLDDSGNAVSRPKIGDVIQLKFTLIGGNIYTRFRVETLIANNAMTGNKALSADLVEDSCVLKKRRKIVTEFTVNGLTSIVLKIKTFRLRHSNTLTFTSDVKVCEDESDCNATMCDEQKYLTSSDYGGGIGRGKRDVTNSEEGTRYQRLEATLFIQEGDGNTATPGGGVSVGDTLVDTERCVRSPAVLTVLVLLLSLILLLGVATVYFFRRAMRMRNKDRKESTLYSYDNSVTKH